VASYFGAPFLAVALGLVIGGVLGGCPGVIILVEMKRYNGPFVPLVFLGFVTAGAVLGALAGAARHRGARTDFGVYPNPGIGPAVEVPGFTGPPLRFSAAQLRAMADLLDRHGQTFQLRPIVGRPTAKAGLPGPDAGHLIPDGGHPKS
jgi:hypothetical protein